MTKHTRKLTAIIDSDRLRAELTDLVRELGGNEARLRGAVLERLKEVLARGRSLCEAWLKEDGRGTVCATRLSYLEDEIVRVLYDFAVTHVYPARNPSSAERMAVVAVGGYGRGTLAPGSDIDLLFLLPYKQTAWGESVVEFILYTLWDLGQKVGHATRSVEDCIRMAKTDQTVRTATLEARFLWGTEELYDALAKDFDKRIVKGTGADFIEAKLVERDIRHQRAGESRYLVEPNVKDGKGGLRDLHTLFWIAKYFYRVRTGADLVQRGVFSRQEYRRFRKCEDFLWAVRCHLHFLTGRAEDRLTFDLQKEMALRLGYTEHPGQKHMERFMKHYFLIAKEVGDLTRIVSAALEMRHVKKTPMLSRFMRPLRRRLDRAFKEAPGFVLQAGRINVTDEEVFARDPVNLIRMFWLVDRHDALLHPDAVRLANRSLSLIDKRLRNDAEANRLFLDILTSTNNPEAVLRRMNETGILGRFVPDFGKVVAMTQFNMYHHYTVDEHLLRAVGILAEIEAGRLAAEHPLSDEIIHEVKNRRGLYVALFLHDIAKGRPEDHPTAGERVARRLCPRLGLTAAETETVAWLVKHHLAFSRFAQSRDLNDRKTIEDFAQLVQSPERLKLLLMLTVADIKAVGPGVWNGWKGQLMRNLYFETAPVLAGGPVEESQRQRVEEAKEELKVALADWPAADIAAYSARHYAPYWLNVDLDRKLVHARLIRQATEDKLPLATAVRSDAFREITELTVYAPDYPRLLSIIAGACAAADANIADAQIFTTCDGMALDSIMINREFEREADELRRGRTIARGIEQALRGEIRLPDMVARKAQPKGRLKAFQVEPQVFINNGWSETFTAIEVNGLDRPGLLYALTTALARLNLNIASARITTYGERAVDVFYVTDLTGHKIDSQARQATITRRLIEALEPERVGGGDKEAKPRSTRRVAAAS
ncbi:MAG: [protein-PII] uridylyltransferase [Hyphomicrobiales bacterium]|nr:[protein-PII] uridylyltransferase [Hyphomicrobiales bacterium]